MAEENTLIDTDTDNTQVQQEEAPASDTTTPPEQGAVDQEQSTQSEGQQDDGEGGDDDEPKGAPDKYELKLVEGADIDTEFMGEFEAAARELDLTNEGAQKFADLGQKLAERISQKQAEQQEAVRDQWREQSMSDKEFGGDNVEKNLGVAKKALDAFASPELKTLLKTSGFGDNPEVIRAFYKVGMAISDDGKVVTGGPSGNPKSQAERLYG